jgi:hypothetical protein
LACDGRRRCGRLSEQDLADLRLDLDEALSELPEQDRASIRRYLVMHMAEVARKANVPRTTMAYRVKKMLKVLHDGRLKDYLDP